MTGQHTDLIGDLGIKVDFTFPCLEKGSTLYQSSAHMLKEFEKVFSKNRPELVIVQGDTTTAFIAALAAHYSHIPVAHIEAGLRTGSLFSPWPEEGHRRLIDQLSSYFFVPTTVGKKALLKEGISSKNIWVVGNTSIDALRFYKERVSPSDKKQIVVTVHRRENQGKSLEDICFALKKLTKIFPDLLIIFFLHPNPAIRKPAQKFLKNTPNIELKEPMQHLSFVELLMNSSFIITDSGGIQEEAPAIGKPVLIVRESTERPEGVAAGTARLIGTKSENIIAHCTELLNDPKTLSAMSKIHFPYGDGYASERIVDILCERLK